MTQLSAAIPIPMSELRRRPGALVQAVARDQQRFVIMSHRKERAALVRVADLDALERAAGKSVELQIHDMLKRLGAQDALRQLLVGLGR